MWWLRVVVVLGLLAVALVPQQVLADEAMAALVEQLKQGQVSGVVLQGKGVQSADSLFLLGWLYDQGRYGVVKDPARARKLLQRAAERGQFDAMHYCWSDCLSLTAAVLDRLRQGVAQQHPQALYLQSVYLQQQNIGRSQSLLQRAVKQRHVDAIGQSYIDRFVEWARLQRGLGEAESKLERCVGEGLTVCYYLLGALYQKHDYPRLALFYYQVLSLVDPELYRRYQLESQIEGLLEQLPQADLGVVRSRVASYLSQLNITGNGRVDRFQRCRLYGNLACVERISQADQQCLLGYFESNHLRGLRKSQGYRRCVEQLGNL